MIVRQSVVAWAKPKRLAGAFGGLGRDVGNGVQFQIERQFEHARGRGKAEHMGLAHEAGADQADAKFGFGHFSASLLTIRAGSR